MTDEQQIGQLYEDMLSYMISKDTVSLGRLFTDDSVLIHMTGHRQPKAEYLREIANGTLNYYSSQTDSAVVTVHGDTAHLVGKSRVNAAVYGGGRHTWRLRMTAKLRRTDGRWQISETSVTTY